MLDRYRELFFRNRIFVHLLEKYVIAPDINDEMMPEEMMPEEPVSPHGRPCWPCVASVVWRSVRPFTLGPCQTSGRARPEP